MGPLISNAAVSSGGGAPVATEATQLAVLAQLEANKDYELKLVKDTGNGNLLVRQVALWDQDLQVLQAPTYYDLAGAVYAPTGPLLYMDTEGAILALLNEVANSTVRTPAYTNIAGIDSDSVAAGARSVSFFNNGPTAATIQGTSLAAGKSLEFNAGGENDTLGAITYVTIATGDLDITTVV